MFEAISLMLDFTVLNQALNNGWRQLSDWKSRPKEAAITAKPKPRDFLTLVTPKATARGPIYLPGDDHIDCRDVFAKFNDQFRYRGY